ncbi:LamG domain-containing protein [Flagellimonas sp. CMM7]|uniref:LamG domain-containing protein n=1 Tax=Flagellimonas sp. CMM7 TaxID=2654676 RepID=UPI0013D1BD37|nr:LamG domain-containing protein [Flagellimonas sp. CMM7]UII79934.1 LamG domain-containing protein [Flagellimonas sp. CMM7]
MKHLFKYVSLVIGIVLMLAFAIENKMADDLLFYASFDNGTSADVAVGDKNIYTADLRKNIENAKPGLLNPDVKIAKGKGLSGNALDFKKKSRMTTFFKAHKNMGYSKENWSGAVSFWLQLDPEKDLEPGYCDPIQITDVNYNDAALWVDFTKNNPRNFRLGVLGDLEVWNPKKLGPDENQDYLRRLVTVEQPPFNRGDWTHIVINFSGLNTDKGSSELFVNAKSKGKVPTIKDPFTWNEEKANIMLGLNYIGLFDELAVFNRPLSAEEIELIFNTKEGLKSILN